ncbi:hypothetical protein [Viscerimonas tarda]
MKIHYPVFSLFVLLSFSCNNDEGPGGSASIEGYVYNVVHQDDNFSFRTDTFPAGGKKVYIKFGNEDYVGDDVDANEKGLYRFDYLREGSYTVYAFSEAKNGRKNAEMQSVSVKSHTVAPAIYIHSGDVYNTVMIKGKVWVKYYNKGSLVRINGQDSIPAVETRVFIKNTGEEMFFDDVRVGDAGLFVFKELQPQKQYEVYVSTERIGDSYKNILFPLTATVRVGEPYKVYPLDDETKLEFTIILNN